MYLRFYFWFVQTHECGACQQSTILEKKKTLFGTTMY
jgi:hypothetical protein